MKRKKQKPKRGENQPLKPLKKFRVYIDRVYYVVRVWRTLKEMRNHRATLGLPRTKCQACTLLYRRRHGKQIGEMHFVQRWFSEKSSPSLVISHEAVHAAFGFLRTAKVDFKRFDDDFDKHKGAGARSNLLEEIVAEVTGNLTRDITKRLKL